jgi:Cu/Ag efflux pump CusA
VQERLLSASRNLPAGLSPAMTPSTSPSSEVMLIGLHSREGKIAPPELRTLADTVIRRRLLAIPGVADVLPMGGGVQQIHVLPDPRRLRAHQLPIEEAQAAVAKASGNLTAGVLTLNSREITVRALGLSTELAELRRTPVKIEGDHVILLGDIARVEYGTQFPRGDAGVNGQPGVIVSVDKAPGVDTLRLTTDIEQALPVLRCSFGRRTSSSTRLGTCGRRCAMGRSLWR